MLSNKFKTIGGRCSAGCNAEVRGSADTLNVYLELLSLLKCYMQRNIFSKLLFCRVYENMHHSVTKDIIANVCSSLTLEKRIHMWNAENIKKHLINV